MPPARIFALLLLALPIHAQLTNSTATQASPCQHTDKPAHIPVPESEMQKLLLKKVDMKPPPGARIQGTVILSAIIDAHGVPTQLCVILGHPMLVQSAIDAVRQWRFKPYRLNGKPVEVETQISITYPPQ